MNADIAGQDRSYRRGLVLGFTLAEVAILIIFALLLALAWHVANKEKEIVTLRGALDRSEVVVAQLREQRRQLESRLAAGDDFDDFFRELELTKLQLEEAVAAKSALSEKLAAMEEAALEMEARASAADDLLEALEEAGIATEPLETAAGEMVERLERLERIEAAMAAGGHGQGDAATFAAELMTRLEQAERLVERQAGQLRNLQRQFGNGMEMPSCWASPDTGKAEYIFGVALTSRGMIVRDNALPHRAADQAELPLAQMIYGREVMPDAFLAMSRALRDWSDGENCRFVVGVYDLTSSDEKAIYIRHLRTVGERFYYYVYKDEPFEIPGG